MNAASLWQSERWTQGNRLAAGVLLWSVLLLVAAIGGFGSRFAPMSESTGQAPALPVLPAVSRDGSLQDMSAYAEVGQRPLLMPDRRPAPVALLGRDSGNAPTIDAVLTSVMIAGDFKMAILTDKRNGSAYRVRLGEVAQGTGLRLVSLAPRSAVFEGPSGQQTYELRVFDGQGGQVPTNVTTVSNASNATAANTGQANTVTRNDALVPAPPGAPVQNAVAPTPEQSQKDQIEAIRKRIEARRAQLREEAARAQQPKVQ